ncbi:MAG: hypothetical protein OEY19_08700, partial [Gammaproteobacteria bacterium]|nr:hypothetical protein [Gammaproteobacteria bacterium]
IVVFISMMLFGFLVFGMALEGFYTEHASNITVRPVGEEPMHWLAVGQLIMAYAFVWIWSHAVESKGITEGVRFGFFMGLFWAGTEMIQYTFIPMAQVVMWVGYFGDIIMMMLAGAMLSLVWPKLND